MHTAHVNDGAAPTRGVYVTQTSARSKECPVQMHSQNSLPLSQRQLIGWRYPLDTGFAHENISAAELSYRTFNIRFNGLFVCSAAADSAAG